jgi:hypothetical protein
MNAHDCEKEAAVLAAAASGQWEADLRAHARGCAACQDAVEVWHYMQTEARDLDASLDPAEIPHPGLIWWRRRILDQHAAARRALWPITMLPLVAGALLFIVCAALAFWQWHAPRATAGLTGGLTAGLTGGLPGAPLFLAFVSAAAVATPIAWTLGSAWYLWRRK